MPRMIVTAAAVALGFVCPAFALAADSDEEEEAAPIPRLELGRPSHGTIDRARLAVRVEDGRTFASLTLAMSTPEREPRAARLDIVAPLGARVTGLVVTLGGHRAVASPRLATDARAAYRALTGRQIDPALLEYTSSGRYTDRFTLDVFPLAKRSPATVELELELPAGAILALDPGPQSIARVELDLDGKPRSLGTLNAATRIELPASREPDFVREEQPHVTVVTSLFADGPVPEGRVPTVTLGGATGCGSHGVRDLDKRVIRRTVKQHHARLRRCYMQVAQGKPTLAGTAELHFTIGADGRTHDIGVDGALDSDAVKRCLADEVAQWSFSETDGATRVNYPLHFQTGP